MEVVVGVPWCSDERGCQKWAHQTPKTEGQKEFNCVVVFYRSKQAKRTLLFHALCEEKGGQFVGQKRWSIHFKL